MKIINTKQWIERTTSRLFNWWSRATIGRLPRLYKRSIFISSVYGLLKETKDPTFVNLSKLNELLRTNYNKEGFSTGVQAVSLIWHSLEKDPTVHCKSGDFCLYEVSKENSMNASKINAVIDMILANTPDWLCYGSPRLMRHDLYVLIKNFGIVGKASVA